MNNKMILNKGALERVSEDTKTDMSYPEGKDFFSLPSNLIPGISGVSGGRVLLGSKGSLQAISLVHREVPLVQAGNEGQKSANELFGKELLSIMADHDGVVESITEDEIVVKDDNGKDHHYDLYNNYNLGRKTYIHNYPKVKVGEKIHKGTLLATSNYTDDKGHMALGVNLTTAVMPYRSGNFEDAWVITESGAKKLESEQIFKYRVEKKMGIETGKNKYVSMFANKFYNNQLTNIDDDGAVKMGTVLNYGDPIILALSPKALKSTDIALGKLSKVLKNAFNDNSQTWDYDNPGTVVDVVKAGDLMTINVKTRRPMAVGDKVCMTPDHEVLTSNGWKAIAEVSLEDKVYTLNPDDQSIELLTPISTPVYDYAGMMYNLKTTQVDMCVTPNHKLYAQRPTQAKSGYSNKYNLRPCKELFGKRYKLKKDGVWSGRSPKYIKIGDLKIPVKTYLTVLGLFLGDGNTFWNVKSGSYGFDIAQKKEPETTVIENELTSLGIKHNHGEYVFRTYSKAWATHLRQFGKAKDKFIPNEVFDYAIEDLKILYRFLMLTDGSEKSTTHCYTTISKQLANDVQRLALHIGYSATIKMKPGGFPVTFPNGVTSIASDCYIVYIYRHKNEPEVNHKHVKEQNGQKEEWIDYSGKVHCLTFDKNHIFYVRKNGAAHWTGNSNAFGAKGVCGSIISDSIAPTDVNGKPVDILLNSMSITSRVAPALAVTIGLGKLAQKEGRTVKFPLFSKESNIENVIRRLKAAGISDTEKLYDPVTGKHVEVLTGPLYFTRLVHIAEDKESNRSQGVGYTWNLQPAKSVDESAKRLGNLSTSALLSHGATAVLRDIATVKATKNDDFWNRLKLGMPAPSPKVPFVFEKFISSLQGAGIKVDKRGDIFHIFPLTDKDTHAMSAGPILNARTMKAKGDKVIAEAGGLFDPTLVGVFGDRYNHINLNYNVPNPISEDFLRKLLGVTVVGYEALVANNQVAQKLNDIDLDRKIEEYTKYLRSGKKTHRDDSLKLLTFLKTLKGNKMQPSDLMITKIPVIPAQYRPMMIQGETSLSSPVNDIYKEVIQYSDALKDTQYIPEDLLHKLRLSQYNAVKAVFGLGDPTSAKNLEKGRKGLLATTIGTLGGSGKTTMFQSNVVNKPIDLVGRAVLVPDAKLDLDECSVPQATLWKMYRPFILRRLITRGVPATRAIDYVDNHNPMAVQALLEELKERPGIVSRDPALHKYNLQGFYLKPNANVKDKTIKLNPLVFKGFNADNDGDQMGLNIPAGEDARKEVIEKLLPSKNLISPKTFHPMYVPSNEAALGLFQSSTESSKQAPRSYKTNADVIRDFNNGKIDIGDKVDVG